jgi:pimeloyl-ACP methyl ester carboxylesterase
MLAFSTREEGIVMNIRSSLKAGFLSAILLYAFVACRQKADAPRNAGPSSVDRSGQEVVFSAADSVKLFADVHWLREDHQGPLILLFHQAGASARGEYAPIIPRLLDHGFSVLALDQRSGGTRFDGVNRTVQALPEGESFSYCDAYPDLEAALRYAIEQGNEGPRIAWGSSYSAALVIRLAAEHPENLAGVLAFSPASGPTMGECSPELYAQEVKTRVLVLRPQSEMESAPAVQQLDSFKTLGFQTYAAAHGVHGSSMLVSSRVEGNVEDNWKAVEDFLDEVVKEHAPLK